MGTCMWDDTKQRKEGNGIFTPSSPTIERNQREGRQDESRDMTKQLEKALATAKTCTWLKYLFPKGIQLKTPRTGENPHALSGGSDL